MYIFLYFGRTYLILTAQSLAPTLQLRGSTTRWEGNPMYQQFRRILLSVLVVMISVGLIGCGQGFKSNIGGAGGALGGKIESITDVKAQIDEAQKATEDAQDAMAEAQAAIASISDEKGNININVFSASSSTVTPQGILSPVLDKLRTVFDTVISKVQLVKSKFDAARAALVDAMAKLDPNNPAHQALISQIQSGLAMLDNLEMQFHNTMQMLASKLDIATAAIDSLVAKGCALIPIPGLCQIAGAIVDMLVLNDVKSLIAEFKAKLLAL